MQVYVPSRSMSRARARMRAPVLVGFFLNGGSPGQARHTGPSCRRCGGTVLWGWSLAHRGPACTSCGRPA